MKKLLLIFMLMTAVTEISHAEEINCDSGGIKNIFYAGPYKGTDNVLSSSDYYQDYYCAEQFIKKYPNKFLTIFGSSRIVADNAKKSPSMSLYEANDNNAIYLQTYNFSKKWAEKHGGKYPILTGAGPGLMEAAARGAVDGKSDSIGYTTYYTDQAKCINDYSNKKDCGAGYAYADNKIITNGLIFSSVSARESTMILHSSAAVILPGGSGTNWEIFQMLEMIKSSQLNPIPVYFLGNRSHWKSYEAYIDNLIARGAIKYEERVQFVKIAETNDELILLLERDLKLSP